MSAIKLFYFDLRGRAEIVRLVLALAGQDYEDVRFSREEWPRYKAEAPFGQAPYLEYQGKRYGQSRAIATFLASENGLNGSSHLERLRIDEVVCLTEDLSQAIHRANRQQDETKKAEQERKLQEEDLPRFFGFFAKLLQENAPRGVFVGKELTLADLYVYNSMQSVLANKRYDAARHFPDLQSLKDRVEANPRLRVYLANRKDTAM